MFEERIILVEGDNSNWYEQAIFIVKKNVPKSKIPVDFVAEAEKIVNNYMRHKTNGVTYNSGEVAITGHKLPVKGIVRKKSGFDMFINIVLLLGCLTLLGLLMYAWIV